MTSTNTFQGLEGAKPSSRVLRPPGGTSSNLFCGDEEESAATRQHNKMASTVFATDGEYQKEPRRSNPPGGRTSGIFGEPECQAQNHRPSLDRPTNNIFGKEESTNVPSTQSSLTKQKDKISWGYNATAELESHETKDLPAVLSAHAEPEPSPPVKDHEPHLGPRPRSHNKVINPPGGKSSVVFY